MATINSAAGYIVPVLAQQLPQAFVLNERAPKTRRTDRDQPALPLNNRPPRSCGLYRAVPWAATSSAPCCARARGLHPTAAIRDMKHVNAGPRHEQFARDVAQGPGASF